MQAAGVPASDSSVAAPPAAGRAQRLQRHVARYAAGWSWRPAVRRHELTVRSATSAWPPRRTFPIGRAARPPQHATPYARLLLVTCKSCRLQLAARHHHHHRRREEATPVSCCCAWAVFLFPHLALLPLCLFFLRLTSDICDSRPLARPRSVYLSVSGFF